MQEKTIERSFDEYFNNFQKVESWFFGTKLDSQKVNIRRDEVSNHFDNRRLRCPG